ncbi:MAG: enoyl-CoA hydratase-related protein [Pseudomonadota bacterium]
MTYECFSVNIADGVAHIQMTRPEKRNSMIPSFWTELPAIVRDIDRNSRARAIVISSTGPHFTAGIDIAAFGAGAESEPGEILAGPQFYEQVQHLQDAFSALEEARIPVLAAIQGGCIGGGVDLATACDLRFATEDAFFTVEETNIGMTADVGTFPRLCYLMPEGLVKEMCLLARPLPAARAHHAGLVNGLYPDHEALIDGVLQIAAGIAAKAPLAVRGCKRVIHYARDHSTADVLDYIAIWNASMMSKTEIAEALMARMEKRPGKFVDLPKIVGGSD